MALTQHCPKCRSRFALGKNCPKCGRAPTPKTRTLFIELRDQSGRKIYKSLGNVSLEFAKNKEAELRRVIREGKLETPKLRWGDIGTIYIRKLESSGRAPMYIKDTVRYLNEMSSFWSQNLEYDKLSAQLVVNFRSELTKKSVSPATIDRYFAAGRAAWSFSVKDLANPFSAVGLLNVRNEVTRFLSDAQRYRLLEACKQQSETLYQVVFLALGTGLRKNNILRLSRNEVDFENGCITVVQKGNRKHVLYPAESIMSMLQSIPDNSTEWFWVNPETMKPFEINWRVPWRKAKALAGIPKEFRFHDLRHDAGTLLYSRTGDIKMVSEVLGHSSLKVTNRYAHTTRQHLQKGFNAIDPMSTHTPIDK